jgi:hypothetical protein
MVVMRVHDAAHQNQAQTEYESFHDPLFRKPLANG